MKALTPLEWLFFGVEALFFVGLGLIFLIQRRLADPEARRRLWQKFFWYVAIVNGWLLLIIFGPPWLTLGIMALSWGLWQEFRRALQQRGEPLQEELGLGVVLLLPWLATWLAPPALAGAGLAAFLFLLLAPLGSSDPQQALQRRGTTVLGVCYLGFLPALLLLLRRDPNGAQQLAFLYVLVTINDGFAEVWGRLLGRRPLCPHLSPGKTWGGAWGGGLTTLASACLFHFLVPELSWGQTLGAGVLVALAGLAGDLVASALKRDLGLKDFGNFFPGHGGWLDRFDSLLVAGGAFYLYLLLLQADFS